jgi:hypothetical protein
MGLTLSKYSPDAGSTNFPPMKWPYLAGRLSPVATAVERHRTWVVARTRRLIDESMVLLN